MFAGVESGIFSMEYGNELSSSLSFAANSYPSNSSSTNGASSPTSSEVGSGLELLSLNRLSASLEKLLIGGECDYSNAEIEVEGVTKGVDRCILGARSQFFHDHFRKSNHSVQEGKPKYRMSELVPDARIGYEVFMVVLNYLYTGKVKDSPVEVSTCVDEACAHDACGAAIDYYVQMMYASATFEINELMLIVQRRLLNFVDKAFVEDVIPILVVAHRCKLAHLLTHCLQRIARSDMDSISIEKELPNDVLSDINSLRRQCNNEEEPEEEEHQNFVNEKSIKRIHRALDSDDVELLQKLMDESSITLDSACALHYAAAYCYPKLVNELLNLNVADVNLRNSRGYTVLHVAARRKDPSIVLGLLHHGASVSDTTRDGQTAVTICRRLTRPKDYNEAMKKGQETNKDRLCIDMLVREMSRNPLAGNVSMSSMMVADDLHMRLLLLENRVAMARALFPLEARLAMQIAHADSTFEFPGFSASKGSYGNFREVDLNEIPIEQVKKLKQRLQALQKTVETGRRFFPNCSEVLDRMLEDDTLGDLLLEKGTREERRMKKMRYMELKADVVKAFNIDMAANRSADFSSSSSTSSSPKSSVSNKVRKKIGSRV